MVEILGLAADIDHAVDRRRAAEHFAARPEHTAVGGAGVGLGLVAPVDTGVSEGLAEPQWDMDPAVGVLAAGFEKHHPDRRIFAEPRRHRATGRAGPDHDEISLDRGLLRRHVIPPDAPALPMRRHIIAPADPGGEPGAGEGPRASMTSSAGPRPTPIAA